MRPPRGRRMVSAASTPRTTPRGSPRRRARASSFAEDDELAELQRRFAALEEEKRERAEKRAVARLTGGAPQSHIEAGLGSPSKPESAADLARLDSQVSSLRRRHDELVHANVAKRAELDKLSSKLRDLSREAEAPTAQDNPTVREIESLEQRLKKAVARYEDEYEVRRTYEQIVKRLKEERIGFANRLEARESTLKAREADYEDLLLMSHEANHSKELAKQELAKFEQAVAEERRRRDKQLAERKALVAKRTEAKTELERREKARREALAAAQRDSGADGDRAGVSEADIAEEQEKIRAYEAAFREIKEATGVSDVSEVIEKFLTQETTHRNLEQMTAEAQADIDKLTAKKREAHERMQRLKYSAEAGEEPPQVASPEPAGRTHERHRHRHERLAKVLVAIKAGVEHLADRLDGVDIEEARLALTEDNMVEVLHQCEKKLRRVIDAIREEEEAMVREMGQSTLKARPDMPSEPMAANNCRIGDVDGEDVDSEEEYEEDLEEEVFDRDALKEQSRGMLDMASKKRTKKRRANGN